GVEGGLLEAALPGGLGAEGGGVGATQSRAHAARCERAAASSTARRSAEARASTWWARVLSDAWLTMKRAVERPASATSTRRLARNVRPVAVMSRTASASPVAGASSTEPYSLMSSAATLILSKNRRAALGYLVATRSPAGQSPRASGDPSGAASTSRQPPK